MKARLVRLGELCTIDRKGIQPEDPDALQLPFVGVEHVGAGTGIINLETNSRAANQRSAMFRFDRHHVLYGKLRPYLNKVATPTFSGACSTELVPLLPHEVIDRSFLAYVLRHKKTVDYIMSSVSGTRMPRTDMDALLSMPVRLPSLSNQLRIVASLDRARNIEFLQEQAQERLREFSTALFVKVCINNFKHPVGRSVPLAETAQVIRGVSFKKSESIDSPHADSVPVLRAGNIKNELELHKNLIWVPSKLVAHSQLLKVHDIVMCTSSGSATVVGKSATLRQDWLGTVGAFCVVIRACSHLCDSEFLASYFKTSLFYEWARNSDGANIRNIRISDLRKLRIPLPSQKNQKIFANLMSPILKASKLGSIELPEVSGHPR